MQIITLNETHQEMIKDLFDDAESHLTFCQTYLSGLENFKAFGIELDGSVKGFVSFYTSPLEPAWFLTTVKGNLIPGIVDYAINYHETIGKLKFYSTIESFRTTFLTNYTSGRYNFIDEFSVPAMKKCIYPTYWEVFFNNGLVDKDTTITCYFLKQAHRTSLLSAGHI
jgi:hypothetical protein